MPREAGQSRAGLWAATEGPRLAFSGNSPFEAVFVTVDGLWGCVTNGQQLQPVWDTSLEKGQSWKTGNFLWSKPALRDIFSEQGQF